MSSGGRTAPPGAPGGGGLSRARAKRANRLVDLLDRRLEDRLDAQRRRALTKRAGVVDQVGYHEEDAAQPALQQQGRDDIGALREAVVEGENDGIVANHVRPAAPPLQLLVSDEAEGFLQIIEIGLELGNGEMAIVLEMRERSVGNEVIADADRAPGNRLRHSDSGACRSAEAISARMSEPGNRPTSLRVGGCVNSASHKDADEFRRAGIARIACPGRVDELIDQSCTPQRAGARPPGLPGAAKPCDRSRRQAKQAERRKGE